MSLPQKIPLSRTLPLAIEKGVVDEIGQLGLALPGRVVAVSGAIVTVAFNVSGATVPQVTMPVVGTKYARMPIQVDDLGVAIPASVLIGQESGLGGDAAALYQRGNLSSLMWLPIGSDSWAAVNPDYVVLSGPNGCQVQDESGAVVATFDKSAGISMSFGSGAFAMDGSGVTLSFSGKSVVINASGVTIDGILFDTHYHGGVTSGSSDTLGPA